MEAKKRGWYYRLSYPKKTAIWGFLFLLPWLLGFLLLILVPMLQTFQYGFNQLEIVPTGGIKLTPAGFDNFRHALLVDPNFNPLLVNTLIEIFLFTPLIIIFSLLCAILLNGKFRGRAVARAIFFIPIIMATGLMMQRVTNLSGQLQQGVESENLYGSAIIARLLFNLGIGGQLISYLQDMVNRIFDIVSLSGIQILIFLSALQSISPSLYEVAKIEGATSYETFWRVTVVMVSPMILTCVIYTMSDLFARSDVMTLVYDLAFRQSRFGLSAAMSAIFLLLSVLSIGLVVLLMRRVVFYYD
ncbi:MAG: sugar ABC transporter permease [Clostridiales bacterium]|nr:sugar ABC transporter permease [Clostridiales bacterium]